MNPTDQTLNLLKGVYEGGLAKAGNTVTTGTGLVAYDLQAPSKNLYPVITILGKRIPRVRGKGGTATNWRAVTAITGSGWDGSGWVPEGQRAGVMSLTAVNKAAAYVTLGEEGALTFEAQSAAAGFENERSLVSMRVLQKAMLKEENAILGGNASLALGTANTPTLAAATLSGATLPAATYSVIVVGLTYEGYQNSSISGGVATTKTVTGQDGQTFTLNGGSGNQSSNATQAITLGQKLTATVTAKNGEVAWAWYVGTAGSEKLQAITTVPTAVFSTPLTTGTQAATAITGDSSTNQTAFDGLLSTAFNSGTAYVNQLAGATLTASGRGTVSEIDTMLKAMWDTYRVSPSIILVNSQEQLNITNKVLQGGVSGSSPSSLLRQNATVGADGEIRAGQVVSFYYNPFALGVGKMIPVVLHPTLPPGTLVAWAEDLPAQYQTDNVPNVAEMHIRRDWYDIEWPLVTRSYQHGIYVEEVLAVYAPFAMGVLTGIGNG